MRGPPSVVEREQAEAIINAARESHARLRSKRARVVVAEPEPPREGGMTLVEFQCGHVLCARAGTHGPWCRFGRPFDAPIPIRKWDNHAR